MVVHSLPAAPGHAVEITDDAMSLLDEASLRCIEHLVEWAAQHDREFNVRLEESSVRRWQSVEDPDWVQVVVDLTVTGVFEDSMRFWEAVSNTLDRLEEGIPEQVAELLGVDVHRR
ncbi:MAG: hypothetical protein HY332_18535 [Chloroflexi bacterium]|nr:hypothetical protein [Chloroflexota bacterium]